MFSLVTRGDSDSGGIVPLLIALVVPYKLPLQLLSGFLKKLDQILSIQEEWRYIKRVKKESHQVWLLLHLKEFTHDALPDEITPEKLFLKELAFWNIQLPELMIERAPRVIVLPGRKATLIDTYRESTADIFRNLTNTSFHDIYFKWPLTPLPKTLAASTTTAWDDQLNGQRCVTATSGCFEQQEIPVNSSDYKNLILQCTKALENDADLISAFIIDPMNCKTVIQLHASDPSLSMFSRHPAYQAIGKLADYHRDIRLPTFHRIVRQCDEPETLDSAETVDLLYSKAYLATGLDVILRDEPCCFCYMALLHSRVRRVYYLNVKTAHPCTATRQLFLHERKSLNHQFLVFQKNRRIP